MIVRDGYPIVQTGRTSERTHIMTTRSPMVFALFNAIRFSAVTVGARMVHVQWR